MSADSTPVKPFKINTSTPAAFLVEIEWNVDRCYDNKYVTSQEFTLPIVGGTWYLQREIWQRCMRIKLFGKKPHSSSEANECYFNLSVTAFDDNDREWIPNDGGQSSFPSPDKKWYAWLGYRCVDLDAYPQDEDIPFKNVRRIIASLTIWNAHRKDGPDLEATANLRVQSKPSHIPETNSDSLAEQLISFFSLGEKNVELKTPCGMSVSVNRDILMARSQVFRAMFSHDTLEDKTREVNLEDVDPEVLQAMVHFINTDTVPSEQLAKYAEKLLIAADRFELGKLQRMCEQQLISALSASNAPQVLKLADTINSVSLKKGCWDVLLAGASDREMLKKLFYAQEERLHAQEEIIRKNGLQ